MKFSQNIKINLISLFFLVITNSICANNWKEIDDLAWGWKFKIGDEPEWADPNFDDSKWESISVPEAWENEGYNGYDGYAWYRKDFSLTARFKNDDIFISLGLIDDVSEIFINGNLIGTMGSFPPNLETAYNNKVKFLIPKEYLKIGSDNVIAVRVYDRGGIGGIYAGDVGLYIKNYPLSVDILLDGNWKFKVGDNLDWKNISYNDSNWGQLIVPWFWDMQGLADYDGFLWYRKTFKLKKQFDEEDLVLLLGKIDDLDQTFLNGKLIGQTGDLIASPITQKYHGEYDIVRGYQFSKADLNLNGENVIAVRVYDGREYGGIYTGPVGIITLTEYKEFLKDSKKKNKNFVEKLFGD